MLKKVASILLIALPVCTYAQRTDFQLLKAHCSNAAQVAISKNDTLHHSLSFPSRVAFSFYRHVLSEQISADCAFDMSCSRFSIMAIKKFGIVKGGLLTADRLTRCHAFVSQETIPLNFNNRTAKVIDDPAMY